MYSMYEYTETHTVKKRFVSFPPPDGMSLTTKLSLGGNNDVITELFLPRGSLVIDIPAGDRKLVNLFFTVHACVPFGKAGSMHPPPLPAGKLTQPECVHLFLFLFLLYMWQLAYVA